MTNKGYQEIFEWYYLIVLRCALITRFCVVQL